MGSGCCWGDETGVLRGITPPPTLALARFVVVVVVVVLVLLALEVLLSSVVRDPLLTGTGGSPRFWSPALLLPAAPPAALVPGDPRSPPSNAIALCC